MAAKPVTRADAIKQARTAMRESFYALQEASANFVAITMQIKAETDGPVEFRTAKKSNPHRADALDSWEYHSKNIQTMSAFIQAELALAMAGGVHADRVSIPSQR